MSHSQEILDLLKPWQGARFRESEIPFKEAVDSLSSEKPLIVAKPSSPASTRWMLYRSDSDKVAILSYAGIWAWGSPLQTGNFVPEGQAAPEGIPEGRIQNQPSYKCELAYAFDTTADGSMWSLIKALEDHAISQPNFNKGARKRRVWQSGNDLTKKDKYIMGAKVFAKRTPHNSRDVKIEDGHGFSAPYEIHPWILEGIQNYPEAHQVPNPNRPLYYDFANGVIKKLEDTNQPVFQKHDIVKVVFAVAFVIGGLNWYPELLPIELTRVGQLPTHLTATTDLSSFPSLSSDFSPLQTGGPITVINGPIQTGKRGTSEEPSDGDPHATKKMRTDTKANRKTAEASKLPTAENPTPDLEKAAAATNLAPSPASGPPPPDPVTHPTSSNTTLDEAPGPASDPALSPPPDPEVADSARKQEIDTDGDTEMRDTETRDAEMTDVSETHEGSHTAAKPEVDRDIEMGNHSTSATPDPQTKSGWNLRSNSTNKTKEAKATTA